MGSFWLGLLFALGWLITTDVQPAPASTFKQHVHTVKLTDTKMSAKLTVTYGRGALHCVILHDNERSAIAVAPHYCRTIVRLQNGGKRNVTFVHDNVTYSFDPNRIFSQSGRLATIKPTPTQSAERVVATFASALLGSIGRGNIVAIHNNSNGRYSVLSYRSGSHQTSAQAVSVADGIDPDNFFITTRAQHYGKLSQLQTNVVLQAARAPDDGSLSVYCQFRCRSYINVEAQHGSIASQKSMLQLLSSL